MPRRGFKFSEPHGFALLTKEQRDKITHLATMARAPNLPTGIGASRDFTGTHFGDLEVLGFDCRKRMYGRRRVLWKAVCHACGAKLSIASDALFAGRKSCGCLRGNADGARNEEDGRIYFLETVGANFMKIGWTKRALEKRVQAVQGGCPYPLILRASIAGTILDERRLHRQFAQFRVRPNGEWFRLEEKLRDYLNSLSSRAA